MCTMISGGTLRTGARGEVSIDIGWGKNTETMTFAFELPQQPTAKTR
jgi:hypothetical protein